MRTLIVGFNLAVSATISLNAQNWPGRSARLVTSGVEVLDLAGATPRRVFTDTAAWGVWDPSISPDGSLLAVVRMQRGVIDGHGYGVPPYPTTVIVDARSGAERLRIPGAYAFTWCGNACVAVLYGVYIEDSEVGPYGDSAAVYDLRTARRQFVLQRERTPFFAPHWSPRDSTVIFGGFYGGPQVSLRDGSQRAPDAAWPNVSGSGRWMIGRPDADYRYVVQPSDGSLDSIAIPVAGRWQVEEWLGQTDKVLLLELPPLRIVDRNDPNARRVRPRPPRDPNAPPPERTYRIWDLATGAVSEVWTAAETNWRGPAPGSCRLFLKNGSLTAAPGCR
jgi:hypothetical protein